MNMTEIEARIAAAEIEREELSELIKPLDEKRMELHREVKQLKEDLLLLKYDAIQTDDERMVFFLDVRNSDGSNKMYRESQALFERLLSPLYTSTYNPDTQQRTFTVTLNEDESDLEEVAQKMEYILPHLKSSKQMMIRHVPTSEREVVRFEVLEHSAGDDNHFTIFYDVNTTEWILTSYWSSRSPDVYPTLREMLKSLISKGGYYESAYDDDEDYA